MIGQNSLFLNQYSFSWVDLDDYKYCYRHI